MRSRLFGSFIPGILGTAFGLGAAFGIGTGLGLGLISTIALSPAIAQDRLSSASSLFLAYPPPNHQTTADRIFLVGTAPAEGIVRINGQTIHRSPAGHFAPSLPLKLGENHFILDYQAPPRAGTPATPVELTITRLSPLPEIPSDVRFAEDSLFPSGILARQPGEWICFETIAPAQAEVTVQLSRSLNAENDRFEPSFRLAEQPLTVTLPDNSAVLLKENSPQPQSGSGHYRACRSFSTIGTFKVHYSLNFQGETLEATAPGQIEILDPQEITIATVTAESGTTRTGPSTAYSRLTPLPKGTQAQITGREGDWSRLDYGAWIKTADLQITPSAILPQSTLRSVLSRTQPGWTELVFPLDVPVPFTLTQGTDFLELHLQNTIAQTDTIYIDPDPLIERLDWHQSQPDQVTYRIQFRPIPGDPNTAPHQIHQTHQVYQQWGYKTRYEGSQLILSLKHPPQNRRALGRSLEGIKIFLDPGHGSENDLGARGPNGYPEKDVTLKITQQLAQALTQRGAIVSLSRQGDEDLWPNDRVALIQAQEPHIAISLHYNALPDGGDAENTQGIGAFWYHPQSHALAEFLHDYLVSTLDRPSYGVFWNNLALTRPSIAPAILLELGFMINPTEFEWIVDETAQSQLVDALAEALTLWVEGSTGSN